MIDYSEQFLDSLVPIFLPYLANGNENYYLLQGYPNALAPEDAYSSITIIDIQDVGTMEEGGFTEYGQLIKQHQYVRLRINTFGKGARTAAARLARAMEFQSMVQALSEVGVGFQNTTSVRDITALVQTAYEQRATFDMVLTVADGNFAECYDPAKEGQASQPDFDRGAVPIEEVCVTVGVTGAVADPDSVKEIASVTASITTET